ncbi:MAG: PEP-CTERM sorting domain-containing protein [Gemmataceae bacterium]
MRVGVLGLLGLALLSTDARADLIGTSVSGQMKIDGDVTNSNWFDPAKGKVPAGFLNTAGTTVQISGSAVEFGFDDGPGAFTNRNTADFNGSSLTLQDISSSGVSASITYIFVDSALNGLALSTGSNSFPSGLTASLVGDTLTIVTPQFSFLPDTSSKSFTAVFNFNGTSNGGGGNGSGPTATPEPTTLALMIFGGVALVGLQRRRLANARRRADVG